MVYGHCSPLTLRVFHSIVRNFLYLLHFSVFRVALFLPVCRYLNKAILLLLFVFNSISAQHYESI